MKLPGHVWRQVRALRADAIVRALQRDGWVCDESTGAEQVYWHSDGRRVSIHYHPRKTYGPGLLKHLLADIGWTVDDLRRLKLVK